MADAQSIKRTRKGRGRRVKVARCIYRDIHGFSVCVSVNGQRIEERYPLNTPFETLKDYRDDAKRRLIASAPPSTCVPATTEEFRRSPDGWCYVYFVQGGDSIKIGRAVDPSKRLSGLQVGHPAPLTLLAAVPAHGDFELAVHDLFEHLALKGEWFSAAKELIAFISRLKAGENPVTVLWDFQASAAKLAATRAAGGPLSTRELKYKREMDALVRRMSGTDDAPAS